MSLTVPAATPTRLSPDERAAVDAVLRRVVADGPWAGGPEVDAFEAEFGAYLGAGTAAAAGAGTVVGCASGTDALVLALTGLGIPEGSVVLVPGHDGGYAATAARLAGLLPVTVDVDAGTAGPTIETLDAAASAAPQDPAALMLVHLHGEPVDIGPVDTWRRARGIPLIEDCAQALGARIDGRIVGTIGDAAAFSFYPTKNLAAIGDAGAVVFADAEAAARARTLAQYGWSERYLISVSRGRNSRLDPLQAAVLRARLPFVDDRNARRAAVRDRYRAAAPDLRFLGGSGDTTTFGVAHHAVARTPERADLIAHLTAHGVTTAIHYPFAVADMPGADISAAPTPEARRLAAEVVSLPCTPELRDDEVETVAEALAAWEAR